MGEDEETMALFLNVLCVTLNSGLDMLREMWSSHVFSILTQTPFFLLCDFKNTLL